MSTMGITKLARKMEAESCPKNAKIVKKYMKSELRFYGLKIPMIRKFVTDFLEHNEGVSLKGLYPELKKLWNSHVFDQMIAALFIMERFEKDFDETTWQLMDKWIDDLDNWALCDDLCALRVKMVDNNRGRIAVLMKWTKSEHMWRRRSGIISTLKLKRFNTTLKVNDIEPLILSLMDDRKGYNDRKEFFIQKAIGWLLRSYGDFEPKAVIEFADKHRDQMSNLAYREATRKILKK